MRQRLGRQADIPVSPRLRQAAWFVVLFLCVFLPIRSPLADATTAAVKAIPDVLIVLLLLWYLEERRLRLDLLPQDLFFLGFLLTALVSRFIMTSPMPPGAALSAAWSSRRVEGKAKLATTAHRAARKVPAR